MNLTKHYMYKLMKYFLLAFVIFLGLEGETAWSLDVKYNTLHLGETQEAVKVNNIENGFGISVVNSLEEEGSTTAYFSPSKQENLEKYGCFSFHIENKSKGEIKLNFIINESSRNYILEDDDVVLVLEDGEKTLKRTTVTYGVYELEEGFKGTVYIPFRSLKDTSFKNIMSWGMTITCKNGESKNFDITNFSYLDTKDSAKFNAISKLKILGDIEMPVPTIGEAIVDYKCESPVKFSLKEEVIGASLSEKGHLSIDNTAKEGDIKVYVTMEDGAEFYFKVKLKKSITQTLSGITGKSLATPSMEEVVNDDDFLISFLLKENVLLSIRVILVLFFISVGFIYLYWRGYFKRFTKDK